MDSTTKKEREFRSWGATVEFCKTAADYARNRAGFPEAFFERLAALGLIRPGLRALDLGTGTGTLARGLAMRGCDVTGLDRSAEMLAQAVEIDRAAGVTIRYVEGAAELTGLTDASFELVTAGQCWHWFDRAAAAIEARRILVPGGRIVIAHFDWIPLPGNIARATEELIERFNPQWKLGNGLGLYPRWMRDLGVAGFAGLESFSFDVDVSYSHAAWRGRIRASAGVGATLSGERAAAFDSELAALLASRFAGDPASVPHRVFAAIGAVP